MALTKNRKNFIILAGVLSLFLFLGANTAFAGGQNCPLPGQGLVPCGTPGCPCEICDLFKMINNIVNYIVLVIVPLVAILFVAYGGFQYITAAGDPGKTQDAKNILTAVVVGLIIIYGAWVAVEYFLKAIGVADWTGLKTWYQISCP
ncbi:MAG: pilin [Parachlamydiales bacterium]|jgi:hypothetical protein